MSDVTPTVEEKLAAAQYPIPLIECFSDAITEAKVRADKLAEALRETVEFAKLEMANEELQRIVALARTVQAVDPACQLDLARGWVLPGTRKTG